MKLEDILDAADQESSYFQQALAIVLPDEIVTDSQGNIIPERPDSHGLTFAGLNQVDDNLPVDETGTVTATPEWIMMTYLENYWEGCKCYGLPYPLCILVFVQAVNQGDSEEIKLLQFALNDYGAHLTVDGVMGQKTLNAAMQCPDSNGLALAFLAKSKAHYQSIVANNPNEYKNLQGWLNRINDLQKQFSI